jgi:transposase InsO family protein
MTPPQGPNQRWSLDFLSDAFSDGRRFRILAVVDDFTRECLALVPDTSLPGLSPAFQRLIDFCQVRPTPTLTKMVLKKGGPQATLP